MQQVKTEEDVCEHGVDKDYACDACIEEMAEPQCEACGSEDMVSKSDTDDNLDEIYGYLECLECGYKNY